ncbi:MAG: hypothetical protein NT159_13805 [Proteobacteria bacterium]|nr:hypothetical protein [Pseudomonadota bacterium]
MNLIRILFAALLLATGAFSAAHAKDLCGKSADPLVVEYPSGGSISLSYQICLSGLSHPDIYWDSSMTYTNVSFDGLYQINGSVGMRLTWANNSIGSLVFKNGPLTFTVGGKQYAVTFNDLTFNFNDRFQLQNTTGTLTINGVTVAADSAYLGYLLR